MGSTVNAATIPANPQIGETSGTSKTGNPLLGLLKEVFSVAKSFLLDKSNRRSLANIGQIGGAAALVVGGASLLFSGIAANLTVAGVPLGIPLMVAGGILLAAGTIYQTVHQLEGKKGGQAILNGIAETIRESLANIVVGTVAGAAVAAVCASVSVTTLVSIVPIVVKIKSLPSKPEGEEWKKFVEGFKENKSVKNDIKEKLSKSESLDSFLKEVLKGVPDAAKGVISAFDLSTADTLKGIPNRIKDIIEKAREAKAIADAQEQEIVTQAIITVAV